MSRIVSWVKDHPFLSIGIAAAAAGAYAFYADAQAKSQKKLDDQARLNREKSRQREEERKRQQEAALKSQEAVTLAVSISKPDGGKFNVEVLSVESIESVKAKIQGVLGLTTGQFNLSFGGKVLEADQSVASYNIQQGETLHVALVKK